MVSDRVTKELHAALTSLKGEREQLDKQVAAIESLLAQLGAPVKRGPGRPKGSLNKRGPGRPRKADVAVVAATPALAEAAIAPSVKRGPGRPKGSRNKPKGLGARSAKAEPSIAQASSPVSGGSASKTRRPPKWSPAAREAARQRMQAYWAERKRKSPGS